MSRIRLILSNKLEIVLLKLSFNVNLNFQALYTSISLLKTSIKLWIQSKDRGFLCTLCNALTSTMIV